MEQYVEEDDEEFNEIQKLVIETCLLKNYGVSREYIEKIVGILQDHERLQESVKQL